MRVEMVEAGKKRVFDAETIEMTRDDVIITTGDGKVEVRRDGVLALHIGEGESDKS